jgi:hypothetical protein
MKGKIKLSAFIIFIFYGLIFLTIILIGGISLFATFRYAEDTGAQTMDQKLTAAESNVERMTDSLKRELAVEGTNPVVLDHSLPVDFRSDVFAEAAEKSDFIEFSVALSNGITYNSGGQINISDRDYFIKAIEGAPYISSPLMSRRQGAL